jgi:hypothetical protein
MSHACSPKETVSNSGQATICCASGFFLLSKVSTVLYTEELHNLYSSPNIIRMIRSRRMRPAGHVARMGEKVNAYRLLVGQPEGKRPLERLIHR